MAGVVIRENKYARVISHARGASYEVQEKVGNKWVRLTIFHGDRAVALHTYKRLTKFKKAGKDWAFGKSLES